MIENYVQLVLDRLDAELPGLDKHLAQLYALLALTKGRATTLEDVHNAWALFRNTSDPQHRSLVPFGDLAPEVQELDHKYMVGIHRAVSAAVTDRNGRQADE